MTLGGYHMIYLDYAATTPMRKETVEVFSHVAMNMYGNSSSLHDLGTTAQDLLNNCRAEIAKDIGGHRDGIYFTGSGSEANILAIQTLLNGNKRKGTHIITTKVEHASIYHLFKKLEKEGYDVTFLDVNKEGQVEMEHLRSAIRPNTCLVSIQHANSETGTIQPLREIGQFLKEKNILFHSDCVQTYNKLSIDVTDFNLDSLSISAHKLYGPKGVGCLYINPKVPWSSIYEEASHEGGMRPGTVNVPGIAAFTTAAQLMKEERIQEMDRLATLKQYFIHSLKNKINTVTIEGSLTESLPNIVALRFAGIEGQHIMLECNRAQIAISTGSACQIGAQSPSRSMKAIGLSDEEARELIRISFGKHTTIDDIKFTVQTLEKIVNTWL